ncbi:DinB family protein [Mucilaginibacter segetis]|uniref:DinB family protein n=1 Tax=Mucilaginibacter segetis TaxID=2793071 RepID=A0A934PT71_9SPHI|nr:DinB family protein [Mucilaginibacter segetis]MBK0379156.1 DinB family protein [Mucilaginibacter segetis]
MYKSLLHQYQLILDAREALFTYCENIKPDDLLKHIPEFNNSTISGLLIHSANTYLYWLGIVGQQSHRTYFSEDEVKTISSVRQMYAQIDVLVNDFILQFKDSLEVPTDQILPNKDILLNLTPLQLFTHVITHEFHHKGQLLTMSRLLGYTPADTDVIRF